MNESKKENKKNEQKQATIMDSQLNVIIAPPWPRKEIVANSRLLTGGGLGWGILNHMWPLQNELR